MTSITFTVPGLPRPGGSKRGFVHKKTGRVIITEDCRGSKDWRTAVAICGAEAMSVPLDCPVTVDVEFRLPRPKSHFGARGLRASAPAFPAVKPDATKLWRSTEDALSGIAWRDDALIVDQRVRKVYAESPGCRITVSPAGRVSCARVETERGGNV